MKQCAHDVAVGFYCVECELEAERAAEGSNRPRIITICGSSRFIDVMAVLAWEIEKSGMIALSLHLLPRWYCGDVDDHIAEAQGVAEQLDALHLRKIDMCDEVWVVCPGGYIGESTSREIAYAQALGLPVKYFDESRAETERPASVQ